MVLGPGRIGDVPPPEEIADQVILTDVVGEVIDAHVRRCASRGVERGGQSVEVAPPEHVGFADDARCDGDGVDRGVELGVAGGEEELFQAAAAGAGDRGAGADGMEGWVIVGVFSVEGTVHVDADREVVHELIGGLRVFVGLSE